MQEISPPPYHHLPTKEWVFPNTYCERRSNLEHSPANCQIYDHRRFAAPYGDFRKAELFECKRVQTTASVRYLQLADPQ